MTGTLRTGATTRSLLRAAPLVFLGVFFAWPVANVLLGFASWGTLVDVVRDDSFRSVAWFTLWQAVASTVVTLAVGLPLTWAVTRWTFPGVSLLRSLATVPFLMPAVVVAGGVLSLVPGRGVGAILWAHLSFNVAVVVRVVGARWASMGTSMEEAGASLGAPPWRVFGLVTWPLLRESVRNATSLVFAFCFSSFAVIAVLGGASRRTLETEVFTQAVRLGDVDTATALALVQTVIVMVVLALGRRRSTSIGFSDVDTSHDVRHVRERIAARWLPPLVAAVAATVTVAPLGVVMVRSLRYAGSWTLVGWRALFDGTVGRVGIDVPQVLGNTALNAGATVLIAVPLALAATRRGAVSWTERASFAPLLVSSVTLGLGLVVTFDSWPVEWRSDAWLIPVVHAVVALPLAVYTLGPAVRGISSDLLAAASDLGATPARRWWCVDLPLLRPALVRAASISAAVSIGEFGATSFLARSGSMTVPIAIGQLLNRPGPLLQQAGFALVALTTVIVVATSRTS